MRYILSLLMLVFGGLFQNSTHGSQAGCNTHITIDHNKTEITGGLNSVQDQAFFQKSHSHGAKRQYRKDFIEIKEEENEEKRSNYAKNFENNHSLIQTELVQTHDWSIIFYLIPTFSGDAFSKVHQSLQRLFLTLRVFRL